MHSDTFLNNSAEICSQIDRVAVEDLARELAITADMNGRVFVLGIGGSAGNASHMVNDLRKLCSIEAYAPTDNVSELTARTNDDGFNTIFKEWLRVSKLTKNDTLFILSVGGGSKERGISLALIEAIDYAKENNATVLAIVGKPDGYAAKEANHCVVIPSIDDNEITPQSEAFQAIVWHCLVSNPLIQTRKTTW